MFPNVTPDGASLTSVIASVKTLDASTPAPRVGSSTLTVTV